jgi:hypothetical protein
MPQKPPASPISTSVRIPAPHIQSALVRAAQAKLPDRPPQHGQPQQRSLPSAPPARPPQPEHVRRALSPAQAKLPDPPPQARSTAPHVRDAVASVQRKVPLQTAGRRPLASHIQTALASGIQRKGASSAPVVQRLRSGYRPALPPGVETKFSVDDATPQGLIDAFVEGLKKVEWYRSDEATKDTKTQVLSRIAPTNFPGPNGLEQFWQCASCKKWVPYSSIELGHKTNWKTYLKAKGAVNATEAKIAYNDLNNLQVECSTCNSSHAFEKDEEGSFKDLPARGDFPKTKAGAERFESLLESYSGVEMDVYEDDSMGEPEGEGLTLVTCSPITLAADLGGIQSGAFETFRGATVRVTDQSHTSAGKTWLKVNIVTSMDPKLPEGIDAWATVNHLKKGVVKAY